MVTNRDNLFAIYHEAANQVTSARAKEETALEALRLCGWGKIEKISWDFDAESDDQGGSYYYIYDTKLTIAGQVYPFGPPFESYGDFDLAEGECPHLDVLMKKYALLGHAERFDQWWHSIAEVADLTLEEVRDFLSVAELLSNNDKTAAEIIFPRGDATS